MTLRELVEQINIQGNVVIREIENGENVIDLVVIKEVDWLGITKELQPYAERTVTFMYAVKQIDCMPTMIIEIAEEEE